MRTLGLVIRLIQNWACTNFGQNLSTSAGVATPGISFSGSGTTIAFSDNDGCGRVGGTGNANMSYNVTVDHPIGEWIITNATAPLETSHSYFMGGPLNANGHYEVYVNAASYVSEYDNCQGNGASSTDSCILVGQGGGSVTLSNDRLFTTFAQGATAGVFGIQCEGMCNVSSSGSTILGGSTGNSEDILLPPGSSFYDIGHPNTFSATANGSVAATSATSSALSSGGNSQSTATAPGVQVLQGQGIIALMSLGTAGSTTYTSVTDTTGCSFTAETTLTGVTGSGKFFFCASAPKSSFNDIIVGTYGTATTYATISVWVIPAGGVFDVQGTNGSGSTATSATVALTAGTTNETYYVMAHNEGGSSLAFSAGGSAVFDQQINGVNGGFGYAGSVHQTFSGSGSNTVTINWTGGSVKWDAYGIAIKGLPTTAQVTGTNSFRVPILAGNLVPSANFGTNAAVSVPTGNLTRFTFTLTNGSGSVGASPTIAFTFPLSLLAAPSSCSLWQVGGTQAITALTEFLAPSSIGTTGVTFTYNGTPTINDTEFYQGSCGN